MILKPTYKPKTRRRQPDDYLRRHPWCERCGSKSVQRHHIKPVGMGGSPPDSPLHSDHNKIALCRRCHSWAHKNPKAARDEFRHRREKIISVKSVQA